MTSFAQDILLALSGFSLICLFFGFIEPSFLLWWEDTQHRMKILRVYGGAALVFFLLYLLLKWWLPDSDVSFTVPDGLQALKFVLGKSVSSSL